MQLRNLLFLIRSVVPVNKLIFNMSATGLSTIRLPSTQPCCCQDKNSRALSTKSMGSLREADVSINNTPVDSKYR